MRKAEIARKTNETDIKLKLNLDGTGVSNINTGCGFLDHMLTLFARHARFDLDVSCVGDDEGIFDSVFCGKALGRHFAIEVNV